MFQICIQPKVMSFKQSIKIIALRKTFLSVGFSDF